MIVHTITVTVVCKWAREMVSQNDISGEPRRVGKNLWIRKGPPKAIPLQKRFFVYGVLPNPPGNQVIIMLPIL